MLAVALLNGPMNQVWRMRTAYFTDPDGHILEVAQELPKPDASSRRAARSTTGSGTTTSNGGDRTHRRNAAR